MWRDGHDDDDDDGVLCVCLCCITDWDNGNVGIESLVEFVVLFIESLCFLESSEYSTSTTK
jgi:hypothetical protein